MSERRIFTEYLNDSHGFFYTVDRSLYQGRTKYQKIELLATPEHGAVLLLDDITQVTERSDWQYHEPLVHYPLLAHPAPERVLIIGGGDGGALREVLKHPVREVDFIELDEEVVEFSRVHLAAVHQGSFEDPRVNLRFSDGRAWVEEHPGRYDAVIMDMTDPFGPSRMLYTAEFYRLVLAALRDDRGVFSMHSESPVARPVAYRCIGRTLASVFPVVRHAYAFIKMYATFWSFAVAGGTTDIRLLTAPVVNERLGERGIRGLRVIDGDSWGALQTELPYLREIPDTVPVITDAHPVFPDHFTAGTNDAALHLELDQHP